ncbi:tripartite tricarboxylate transporter TctB family protein [Stappia stellulata]|uniref:tripartite tricarboxylate transporter TctB family protein n=1 Tax=Stappia stellulata TaxID=71235 RepID=UPI000413DC9D|nr:tripartite tricarboxylate transporter TctB family protein [Stappia stellulata]
MLTRDRIGALLMLAFSLGYGAMIFNIPLLPFQANQAFTARTLPQALSILGVVLSLALLLKPLRGTAREDDKIWRANMIRLLTRVPGLGFPLGKVLMLCVAMVFYGFTVRPLGFLLATTLFLVASMYVLGERRHVMAFSIAIGVTVFFWVLMTQFLDVYIAPLPTFLGR